MKAIHYLPHIKPVEIVFRVVLFGDPGYQEILFLQVVFVDLSALHDHSRLPEYHISPFGPERGKARFSYFVNLAARMRATELQGRAVGFGEEGEGILPVFIGKTIGVSLWADVGNGNGQVPEDAHVTPACGHGIKILQVSGSDQHPVFIQKLKYIIGDLGGLNGSKIFHGVWFVGYKVYAE